MRQAIRDELLGITPTDETERTHLDDALAWVASGAPLFRTAKPATPPKHLVAYFVVVDSGHILLVDHRNAGMWLPPGGHVEPDEHPRDTVQRELAEELGLTAPHPIAAPLMVTCTTTIGATPGHVDVSLWYVVQADRTQPIAFDRREFHGVRWFRQDALPTDRVEANLARFVTKLVQRIS